MAYCFKCGGELFSKQLDGNLRLYCPNCGWIYYPQLKVSAAGLIESQGKILLVRRKHWPWQGAWYLPAGYVEADEDPAAAAIREVKEEIGLSVRAGKLFGVYYFDDDPRGKGLLVVYNCQVIGGDLSLSDEVDTAEYFEPGKFPNYLTGAGHEHAIHDWQDRMSGLKRKFIEVGE